MPIDGSDTALHSSSPTQSELGTPTSPGALAWFPSSVPGVEVVFKKRRLANLQATAGHEAGTLSLEADAAERRPRVFVLAKPGSDQPVEAAATSAAAGETAEASSVRRRRRRPDVHRPSPVLHIVAPSVSGSADAAQTPAPAQDGTGFHWQPPAVDEYQALKSALRALDKTVAEARHASAWRARPPR